MFEFFSVVRFVDANARSEVDGFDETGLAQSLLYGVHDSLRRAFPLVATVDQVVDNRQTNGLKYQFHFFFVHAERRA